MKQQREDNTNISSTHEVLEDPTSDGKPALVSLTPKRRGTGPRTASGRAVSSKNALKHGFFAKDIELNSSFFKNDKREFLRLRRELIKEWQPEGASDLIQIEIAAFNVLQYRRLIRVQHL